MVRDMHPVDVVVFMVAVKRVAYACGTCQFFGVGGWTTATLSPPVETVPAKSVLALALDLRARAEG